MWRDAVGTAHGRADESARIVSLVPSITELICDLGLAGKLAGRTGFALIDGEAASWYGSRAIAGLDYLRRIRKRTSVQEAQENRFGKLG
jgi:hypothetical protein